MAVDLAGFELFVATGQPVVGATVTAHVASNSTPNPNAASATTTTDANGKWAFAALADGKYDIRVVYSGKTKEYKGNTQPSYSLGTGTTITLSGDARGDLYYRSSGGVLARLAVGTATQVLHGGSDPAWGALVLADLPSPPRVVVTHSVAQSINNAVETAVAFNTETVDTDTIHDTVVNNTRLTCKTAGLYYVHGRVEFASNATGYRQAAIKQNGVANVALTIVPAINGSVTALGVSALLPMIVNDYVELAVYQTSGGALNVDIGNGSPGFEMLRVSA